MSSNQKMNPAEIISKTKKKLNIITWLIIISFIIGTGAKLSYGELVWSDGVSLCIGIFIIYSLYEAKEWAKIYITITSGLMVLITFFLILGSIRDLNILMMLLSVSILLINAYLIYFLNTDDTYEKYQKLVQKGYDLKESKKIEISQIIDAKKLIPIDFKSFKGKEDYLKLTKEVFDAYEMNSSIEKIYCEGESKIYVEGEDAIFELEFNSKSIFFDRTFISKLNEIIEKLRTDDKALAFVYPNSTIDMLDRRIALVNHEELMKLKSHGFYE